MDDYLPLTMEIVEYHHNITIYSCLVFLFLFSNFIIFFFHELIVPIASFTTLSGKLFDIKRSINASYYSVLLIKLSLLLRACELSSLYSSSISPLLVAFSLFTESSFSLCELSVESSGYSSVLFGSCASLNHYLNLGGYFTLIGGRLGSCSVNNLTIS